jgi:hypothetical protein
MCVARRGAENAESDYQRRLHTYFAFFNGLVGLRHSGEVTTDYLLGSQREDAIQDKVLLKYLREVDDMRQAIIKVLDACVHDAKTRQAYAS